MTTRHLGRTGFTTTGIGLGCMGLSQGYGRTDPDTATATIHAALEAGVTMVDTAMSYGGGANERLVGHALRSSGLGVDQVQVATKFGIARGTDGVHLDATPGRIATWCDDSLDRLGLDHIDLYYLHRVDPRVPIEDTVTAMSDLVAAGKVRHLGLSEVTADHLARAHAIHPITAVQLEWSMMWREPERDVIPAARELGIGLVAYSPLGRGLLGAQLTRDTIEASSFRATDPRFAGDHLQTNLRAARTLARLAASWDMTPAQLALAWLLGQGTDVVAIPGSRTPARARENAVAMARPLTDDQLAEVNSALPPEAWTGDRRSFAVPVTARRQTP